MAKIYGIAFALTFPKFDASVSESTKLKNTSAIEKIRRRLIPLLMLSLVVGGCVWHQRRKNHVCGALTLYGNVEMRHVDISFQVDGVIENMTFEEGEAVKKGDLLAALDDRDYRANYLKSLAEVNRAKAILNEAISILEMNEELYGRNFISRRKYISHINSRDEANAAYEGAIAASRYQENRLNNSRIYAPDGGTIAMRIQEPGATVKAGQPICAIVKARPVWIRAYIPEANLGSVTHGTPATVTIDTIDRNTGKRKEYAARISYISPVAEFTPKTVQTEDLRTYLVYRINVYIDEPDESLKRGMPATIKINHNGGDRANAKASVH
ncbi:MAG: efflux RND transporter periplasmic adaptor subunit [Puniceicoccales bacterium]|jgi:HlyD family secretion protein|nr:efflux RND transporter periplasmic adaptor subunit [Puniceicoccales bacterium]